MRRSGPIAFLSMLAILGVACTAPPPPPPPSVGSPDGPGSVRTFLYHLNSGPLDPAVEGPRRSVIVLNAWEHRYIAPLKAANPDVTVLVYKDLSSTRAYETAGQNLTAGGLGYRRANPAFFLLDRNGRRQTYASYAGHVVMDAGHPGYQAAWADDVRSELERFGWDGVFIDNVMWGSPERMHAVESPKYGDDWTDAYNAAIRTIGTDLRSSGFQVYANMQEARLRLDLWAWRLQYLDGAMEEFFTGWGAAPLDGWDLEQQLVLIWIAEVMDKTALLRVPTNSIGPRESERYAVAAYLMANGTKAALSHQETDGGYDASDTTYWREYDARLGEPLGGPANLFGLWVREFTWGTSLLNTTDQPRRYELHRPMRRVGGTVWVTVVDVPPRSGRVYEA